MQKPTRTGSPVRTTFAALALLTLFCPGAGAAEAGPGAARQQAATAASGRTEKKPPISRTVFYPVLAAAPLFGASVDLPAVDLPGGGVEVPSGSTATSFNGALLAGFIIERERWFVEATGLWAGLSAERERPRVKVDSDVIYGLLNGGIRVYGDFAVTAGVRRIALKIGAEVEGFGVERKAGVWDPLVGLSWRKPLRASWTVTGRLQGGGFGVGTDAELAGNLLAEWRFAGRFGLALGYEVLHFRLSETVLGKKFETRQTLHGPSFGLGIYLGGRM